MPSHRAYYRSAEEAREAGKNAVERLNAQWTRASSDAGSEAAGTAPVVDVRIEGVTPSPVLPPTGQSTAAVRVTGPDGRQEIAAISMPNEQANVLLDKASGTVEINRTAMGYAYTQVRVFGRVAKSVQVTAALTGSPPTPVNLTTSHVLQDRFGGKKYQCAATTISTSGTHTVLVTEVSSADTGDVTHGSVLEFLAPPLEINPIARVDALLGFTVTFGDELTDAAGRAYEIYETASVAASSGLSGDLHLDVRLARAVDDGIDDDTALVVGDELTFVTASTNVRAVAEIASIVDPSDTTIAEGDTFSRVLDSHVYRVVQDSPFGDRAIIAVPILSVERGPAYNLVIGQAMAHQSSPSALGTVATAISAATYPERFASQVVGSAMTWASNVYRATDGRWICDVYTDPPGS